MIDVLEKVLGLGVIPPEWKQRVYSLLLSLVALVELFVDIPDEYAGEAFLMKVATVVAVLLAFGMKVWRNYRARA